MNDQIAVQMLGKYRIIDEIGHGGFATVYRAEDTALGREVALKVLDPLLMRDQAFVTRFQREARAAARLEHPQIVPIYDVGASEERLFIAMRLVRGSSLARALAEGKRYSWEEMLQLLQQVGDALRYAHAEGVIHRDIKPDNILLDERSGALLSDFGFARLVGTSSMTQSISGGIVGTPAYMAPEIWEGAEATPATDVYALGCVVYEMLTGKALFGGSTPMAVMRAHDQGAHLPQEWTAEVPQELGKVLQQAVARKADERYATVPEFLAALEGLQTAEVKKKRVAEVARLLAEAQNALEERRYEDAVTAAEALLVLQPEHEAGLKVLKQSQAELTRHADFAAQLAEKAAQHEEESQQLEQERTALEARAKELAQAQQARDEELKRLGNEKARIEIRLGELRLELQEHARLQEALQHEREALEQAQMWLEQQRQQWAEATRLLEKGDWGGVEQWLSDSTTPQPQDSASTTEDEQEDELTTVAWVFIIALVIIMAIIASFSS